jgi:uncharacterized protein
MKKIIRILLYTFSISLLLGFIAAWIILPDIILKPYRASLTVVRNTFPDGITPDIYGMSYEDYDIITSDNVKLEGLLIHADSIPKANIILIHGIGAYKEIFFHLAKRLSKSGFNVLLFDLRAMGQSGGEYCTYGFLEKQDVKQYTDSLISKFPNLPVGVYGTSLGGAIALQSLSNDPRLQAGIIECTYDKMYKVVRAYTERFIGFPFNLVADFALWRAEMKAGFDADEMNPVVHAANIRQPVFISHGDKDVNIPISFGKNNFDALRTQNKIFYTVPGADHNGISKHGGKDYEQAVSEFLEKHLVKK